MAEREQFIRASLNQGRYTNPDKTRKDILEVTGHYGGLKPTYEAFVFNNGNQKQLLCLNGTIPIRYKGSYYHIPIMLWLLDTHPVNPPMVYVKPTLDMRIKVSKHVDHNGKIYLPYLHDWKPDQSDLMDLIQVLIMTFQEQPPVYSVKINTPPPPPPSIQQNHMPGVPYPQPNFSSTPYPPYPMPSMPMPMPSSNPNNNPNPNNASPAATSNGSNNYSYPAMRASLISACEEKINRRLEEISLANEILIKTGEQMKEGSTRLETFEKRMKDESKGLEESIELLKAEILEYDEKIRKGNSEEEVSNIDECIQPAAPLYKQIVNSVAEESALEDTIYYIGEAFRRHKIDLDQFMKNVRELSRKQFMLRAVIQKCRSKAGLGG